jgi:hypothetical protein
MYDARRLQTVEFTLANDQVCTVSRPFVDFFEVAEQVSTCEAADPFQIQCNCDIGLLMQACTLSC